MLKQMLPEITPRLSFSDDLDQDDRLLLSNLQESRRDASLLEPSSDFEFRISGGSDQENSSADELFKNGRMLPARIRTTSSSSQKVKQRSPSHPPPRTDDILIKKGSNVLLELNPPLHTDKSPPCNGFWSFNRSSSVRTETKKSQLFSVTSLYRSKSTGSAVNPPVKDNQKRGMTRQRHSTSSSPTCSNYVYSLPQQKSSWRKNCGEQGNGFWVSPILNVPTPCITKGTATLLSLGSRWRGSKEKRIRK